MRLDRSTTRMFALYRSPMPIARNGSTRGNGAAHPTAEAGSLRRDLGQIHAHTLPQTVCSHIRREGAGVPGIRAAFPSPSPVRSTDRHRRSDGRSRRRSRPGPGRRRTSHTPGRPPHAAGAATPAGRVGASDLDEGRTVPPHLCCTCRPCRAQRTSRGASFLARVRRPWVLPRTGAADPARRRVSVGFRLGAAPLRSCLAGRLQCLLRARSAPAALRARRVDPANSQGKSTRFG